MITSEKSDDGKRFTTTQIDKSQGSQAIDGGVVNYSKVSKASSSVYQDGDNANFTKSFEESKRHAGQEVSNIGTNTIVRTKTSSSSTRTSKESKSSGDKFDSGNKAIVKTVCDIPGDLKTSHNVTKDVKTLADGSTVTTITYETRGSNQMANEMKNEQRTTRTERIDSNNINEAFISNERNDAKNASDTITINLTLDKDARKSYDTKVITDRTRTETRGTHTAKVTKDDTSKVVSQEHDIKPTGSYYTELKTTVSKSNVTQPETITVRPTEDKSKTTYTKTSATADQYATTYRQDYTNKRISVEISPTHDAFARSLRCVSPDHLTEQKSKSPPRNLSPEKFQREDNKKTTERRVSGDKSSEIYEIRMDGTRIIRGGSPDRKSRRPSSETSTKKFYDETETKSAYSYPQRTSPTRTIHKSYDFIEKEKSEMVKETTRSPQGFTIVTKYRAGSPTKTKSRSPSPPKSPMKAPESIPGVKSRSPSPPKSYIKITKDLPDQITNKSRSPSPPKSTKLGSTVPSARTPSPPSRKRTCSPDPRYRTPSPTKPMDRTSPEKIETELYDKTDKSERQSITTSSLTSSTISRQAYIDSIRRGSKSTSRETSPTKSVQDSDKPRDISPTKSNRNSTDETYLTNKKVTDSRKLSKDLSQTKSNRNSTDETILTTRVITDRKPTTRGTSPTKSNRNSTDETILMANVNKRTDITKRRDTSVEETFTTVDSKTDRRSSKDLTTLKIERGEYSVDQFDKRHSRDSSPTSDASDIEFISANRQVTDLDDIDYEQHKRIETDASKTDTEMTSTSETLSKVEQNVIDSIVSAEETKPEPKRVLKEKPSFRRSETYKERCRMILGMSEPSETPTDESKVTQITYDDLYAGKEPVKEPPMIKKRISLLGPDDEEKEKPRDAKLNKKQSNPEMISANKKLIQQSENKITRKSSVQEMAVTKKDSGRSKTSPTKEMKPQKPETTSVKKEIDDIKQTGIETTVTKTTSTTQQLTRDNSIHKERDDVDKTEIRREDELNVFQDSSLKRRKPEKVDKTFIEQEVLEIQKTETRQDDLVCKKDSKGRKKSPVKELKKEQKKEDVFIENEIQESKKTEIEVDVVQEQSQLVTEAKQIEDKRQREEITRKKSPVKEIKKEPKIQDTEDTKKTMVQVDLVKTHQVVDTQTIENKKKSDLSRNKKSPTKELKKELKQDEPFVEKQVQEIKKTEVEIDVTQKQSQKIETQITKDNKTEEIVTIEIPEQPCKLQETVIITEDVTTEEKPKKETSEKVSRLKNRTTKISTDTVDMELLNEAKKYATPILRSPNIVAQVFEFLDAEISQEENNKIFTEETTEQELTSAVTDHFQNTVDVSTIVNKFEETEVGLVKETPRKERPKDKPKAPESPKKKSPEEVRKTPSRKELFKTTKVTETVVDINQEKRTPTKVEVTVTLKQDNKKVSDVDKKKEQPIEKIGKRPSQTLIEKESNQINVVTANELPQTTIHRVKKPDGEKTVVKQISTKTINLKRDEKIIEKPKKVITSTQITIKKPTQPKVCTKHRSPSPETIQRTTKRVEKVIQIESPKKTPIKTVTKQVKSTLDSSRLEQKKDSTTRTTITLEKKVAPKTPERIYRKPTETTTTIIRTEPIKKHVVTKTISLSKLKDVPKPKTDLKSPTKSVPVEKQFGTFTKKTKKTTKDIVEDTNKYNTKVELKTSTTSTIETETTQKGKGGVKTTKKIESITKNEIPKICITTKSAENLDESDLEDNINIDFIRSKSSRESSPEKICPIPVSPNDETGGKPRYPDKISEPDDAPKRRMSQNIHDIPIEENETVSEFNKIAEVTTEAMEDESLLSVTEKVSKFMNTFDQTDTQTKVPAQKVSRPDFEVTEDLKEDECLLSVSEKVSKFLTTAEKVGKTESSTLINKETTPEKATPHYMKGKVSEKVSRFLMTEKVENKKQFTPETVKPAPVSKPQISEHKYPEPEEISPVPDKQELSEKIKERKPSPVKDQFEEKPKESSDKVPMQTKPTEVSPKSTGPLDRKNITLKSSEAVRRAKILFENNQNQTNKFDQSDILNRPSIWEGRKLTQKQTNETTTVKLTDLGVKPKESPEPKKSTQDLIIRDNNKFYNKTDDYTLKSTRLILGEKKNLRNNTDACIDKKSTTFTRTRSPESQRSPTRQSPERVTVKNQQVTTETTRTIRTKSPESQRTTIYSVRQSSPETVTIQNQTKRETYKTTRTRSPENQKTSPFKIRPESPDRVAIKNQINIESSKPEDIPGYMKPIIHEEKTHLKTEFIHKSPEREIPNQFVSTTEPELKTRISPKKEPETITKQASRNKFTSPERTKQEQDRKSKSPEKSVPGYMKPLQKQVSQENGDVDDTEAPRAGKKFGVTLRRTDSGRSVIVNSTATTVTERRRSSTTLQTNGQVAIEDIQDLDLLEQMVR